MTDESFFVTKAPGNVQHIKDNRTFTAHKEKKPVKQPMKQSSDRTGFKTPKQFPIPDNSPHHCE